MAAVDVSYKRGREEDESAQPGGLLRDTLDNCEVELSELVWRQFDILGFKDAKTVQTEQRRMLLHFFTLPVFCFYEGGSCSTF